MMSSTLGLLYIVSHNPDNTSTHHLMREGITEFNTDEFDYRMPWYLYSIMLIETNIRISRLVGIGVVHVDAFLQESPVWKDIVLE
jgi:hypothetical protein